MNNHSEAGSDRDIQRKKALINALLERMRELERDNGDILAANKDMRGEFQQLLTTLEASRSALESGEPGRNGNTPDK